MTLLVFPDVNVWLALSSRDHQHFTTAWNWYKGLPDQTVLVFCRLTQLSFLRLLTTQSVMGQGTLTQAHAWKAYDQWRVAGGVEFTYEPVGLEAVLRSFTVAERASPKEWADAYLAAFSLVSDLPLVTFDRALAGKAKGAVLLG